MNQKKLIHRLNRIDGQINGIKRRIETNDDDCIQTLQQLKASINALKRFGEAYVQAHLDDCLKKNHSKQDMKQSLTQVIANAFSL